MQRLMLALIAICFALASRAEDARAPVLVFAASSLTQVLEELSRTWRKSTGVPVKLSFAASSLLARQLEAGGHADLFVSADQEWMDYLDARSLISKASRRDLVANRLVLIAPSDSHVTLDLQRGAELRTALGNGRLSIADPDTVPAGRYARAALTSMRLWNQIEDRLARADNVRAALIFVARGESPLGIVYSTDARIERNVRIVATFPDYSHPAITYPAAVTPRAGPDASAFLAFLGSRDAAPVWKKHGFVELGK
jgi:molybdate transport system substrate-binding protein